MTPTIPRRDLLVAEQVVTRLSPSFTSRNMSPAFSNFFLTQDMGMTLLIVVLDTNKIGDHSRYTQQEFLHQLSTDLGGMRLYLSNSTGLRYVFLISNLPKLQRSVELPADVPLGMVALGMKFGGKIVLLPWSKLGHLLIVGMTGSGKSSMLRVIVLQAIRNGFLLLLADIDQTTFAMLEGHANLMAPIATTAQDALQLILKALAECDHRASMYKAMPGYPENIDEYNAAAIKAGKEPLQRVMVVLDESSTVLKVMGSGSGELAGKIAELGWRGRKFGIHFIFGAQEFTKDLVGAVREQVNMSIAFRVKPTAAHMAKAIGCANAHRIPADRPGLAIVDRFGPMQSFFIPKPLLLDAGSSAKEELPELERKLFARALESADGKLTLANIAEWGGVSQKQARRLQANWAVQGWIAKDAIRDNSFCLTPKAQDEVANQQTRQTGQTGTNRSQTRKGDQ
jgi:S-DNA-T family DNA segregation ATPase FtsK/SpoIIIE